MLKLLASAVVGFVVLAVMLLVSFATMAAAEVEGDSVVTACVAVSFAVAAYAAYRVATFMERRLGGSPEAVVAPRVSGRADRIRDPYAEPEPDSEPEPEPEPDSDPEPDSEPDSDPDSDPDSGPEPPSPVTPTVIDELARLDGPQGSMGHTIAILAGSLLLFVAAQTTLSGTLEMVGYLVIVIILHEAGHWMAMKAFGYRDLKVFFIPFLGAAVSGKRVTATGAQRVIVSLAGPLPGLVLAVAFAFIGGLGVMNVPEDFIIVMFGLNAFNLLPFEPLDGGRVMNVLVYHRFPKAEALMRAIAALVMIALAVALGDWFLGLFAFLVAVGAARGARVSRAADRLLESLAPADRADSIPADRRDQVARLATEEVLVGVDVYAKPKILAQAMNEIWAKAMITPPSAVATAVLGVIYGGVVLGLTALVVAAM